MNLSICCCLCGTHKNLSVAIPPGWECNDTDVEDALCPDHAIIDAFRSAQCPGRVGGWTDCPMWKAFAYPDDRSMTPHDYATLGRGICPRRVNGTFTFDTRRGTMQSVKLSDPALIEAGQAFAQAIRDYIKKYPDRR